MNKYGRRITLSLNPIWGISVESHLVTHKYETARYTFTETTFRVAPVPFLAVEWKESNGVHLH